MTPTDYAENMAAWNTLVSVYCAITYIAAAVAVAWAAEKKGRSHPNWFLLSLFVTPAFTVLLLIAAGQRQIKPKHDTNATIA